MQKLYTFTIKLSEKLVAAELSLDSKKLIITGVCQERQLVIKLLDWFHS